MESGRPSQGSSRFTAEYDASGQVIITEGGGKFSLRSRSSSDAVSPSVHGPDDERSLASNGHPRRISDNGSLSTSVALVERPETPPQTATNSRYRRRSDDGLEEGSAPPPPLQAVASDGVGTASTASSSLLRRLGGRLQRRKQDEESSDSDSTTRYSDFSRGQSKRGVTRRRKNRRKKKHKGRSIDKHSDTSSTRGYNASDSYDVGGPDNEYWREMVAEQRRLSSLDRGRRRSSNYSPRRRRRRSEGNKLSVRPPRSNGTSAPASVATGSASHYSGGDSLHRSLFRQSSSTSTVERGCCGGSSSLVPTVIFVVVGCLLIIIGVIRICISFWHEFGSSLWTGALVSEHILC